MINNLQERFNNQSTTLTQHHQKSWWAKVHIIALLGFLVRLIVVFTSDQIHHPDEIFQYLEQAHRLEFGYGIITWEYRYGIRSWILAGLISGLLHILHSLNIDQPTLYIPIIKIFFCCLSMSVVYSSYIITRNIASENAGRYALIFSCFWYELVYFSSKPTPEILAAYCLIFAVVFVVVNSTRKNTILFGFLAAFSVILRFQYLPVVFVIVTMAIFRWKKREALISGAIFISTITFAGYIDYLTWGSFFASYYNNYLFNSIYKISEIFGVQPKLYYLMALSCASMGVLVVFGLLSFVPSKIKKTWLFLLCIVAIILSHSLVAHKEYRFIFAAIPFLLMLMAIIIADSIAQLQKWKYPFKRIFFLSVLFLVFSISVNGFLSKLPFQSRIYPTIIAKSNILSAYLFLSKDTDLVAILNDYSWWHQTGGYYYLHQNVPVYYPDQLKMISSENYSAHISHILCHQNHKPIPNFTTIFRDGDMEIRKVVSPPSKYITLDLDTINILQQGVDDRNDLPKPSRNPIIHPQMVE